MAKAKGMSGGLLKLEGVSGILDPADPPDKYFRKTDLGGVEERALLPGASRRSHACLPAPVPRLLLLRPLLAPCGGGTV